MPNERIEFAPFGRPTRKQLYCLRAASFVALDAASARVGDKVASPSDRSS